MARLLMAVCAGLIASPALAAKLPPRTTPLTAAELTAIHADTTWTEERGASYWAPDGRFVLWQRNAKGVHTYAAGTWTARDDGRVCYEARFKSFVEWKFGELDNPRAGGATFARCYDKRKTADGTIYQRDATLPTRQQHRLPYYKIEERTTNWAVFRSASPKPKDLAHRLAGGDTVTPRIAELVAAEYKAEPADGIVLGPPLTATEIAKTLFDRTLSGTDHSGAEFVEVIAADGITRTGHGVSGKAHVRGDAICYVVPPTTEHCYPVHHDGERYRLVFPDGSLARSFTIAPAPRPLARADVRRLFAKGKTLLGVSAGGHEFRMRLGGGTVQRDFKGLIQNSGTWRISGPSFCTRWRKNQRERGNETCHTVTKVGSLYYLTENGGVEAGYVRAAR